MQKNIMQTKELIITCAGGVKGLLDVSENDTLADIRNQVCGELDADLILPSFAFRINGDIRISKKQETKKRAWDLLDRNLSIGSKKELAKGDNTYFAAKTPSESHRTSNICSTAALCEPAGNSTKYVCGDILV